MRHRHAAAAVLAVLIGISGVSAAQNPLPRRVGPPQDHVDVEVAYVKFFRPDPAELEKVFSGDLAKALADIPVEESEWYYRYKANHQAYAWLNAGPVEVKRQIKREVQVGKLLTRIMDQVEPKTDLEALAKENGLSFHRFTKAGRDALQRHGELGNPRVVMMLWGSGVEKLGKGYELGHPVPYETKTKGNKEQGQFYWPRIFDEPGNFMAIFRITRYHPEPPR